MGYFDSQQVEAMPGQIHQYFTSIMLGFGEKFGQLILSMGSFFGGVIICFVRCPAFAPVCLAYVPIFLVILFYFGSMIKEATIAKLGKLKALGGHTEETMSSLKLVLAFAQEDITLKKYDNQTDEAKVVAQKFAVKLGMMSGAFFLAMFSFYVYSYGIAS